MNPQTRCCAEFYEQDWVHTLLGGSLHPGGEPLSRRLLESLQLPAASRVLDVACGRGTTARLAAGMGWRVTGLDASQANLEQARQDRGAQDIELVQGVAEELPFEDASFDAILCECALSTFSAKGEVLREWTRVLAPGGLVGISDMARDGEIDASLAERLAPWTCLADARSVEDNQRLFLEAGLRVLACHDESPALAEMVGQLKRGLLALALGEAAGFMAAMDLDLAEARRLIDLARREIELGRVQYFRLVGSLGTPLCASALQEEFARRASGRVELHQRE